MTKSHPKLNLLIEKIEGNNRQNIDCTRTKWYLRPLHKLQANIIQNVHNTSINCCLFNKYWLVIKMGNFLANIGPGGRGSYQVWFPITNKRIFNQYTYWFSFSEKITQFKHINPKVFIFFITKRFIRDDRKNLSLKTAYINTTMSNWFRRKPGLKGLFFFLGSFLK